MPVKKENGKWIAYTDTDQKLKDVFTAPGLGTATKAQASTAISNISNMDQAKTRLEQLAHMVIDMRDGCKEMYKELRKLKKSIA